MSGKIGGSSKKAVKGRHPRDREGKRPIKKLKMKDKEKIKELDGPLEKVSNQMVNITTIYIFNTVNPEQIVGSKQV